MIISQLIGGLGNQMFEYAAAYVAAKHARTELKVDNLFYNDQSRRLYRFEYRPFALGLFNISGSVASPNEIAHFTYPRTQNKYIYHLLRQFHHDNNIFTETDIPNRTVLTSLPNNCYLKGYFQKYEYFAEELDDIRHEFTFKQLLPTTCDDTANQIKHSTTPICIVFRRGDYVGHPVLDVVTLNYYYQALAVLDMPQSHLFVFSDDIPWCQKNFTPTKGFDHITFVDQRYTGAMGGNYLQLMMLCHHFIIPNSTYPYWAALLSDTTSEKTVIAPKIWYKGQDPDVKNSILPPQWIAL